jgi:hypothetical protein
MSSIKDKLKKARLPERTVQLCLNGDLVAAHEEAERQLEQAQRSGGDSLAGNGAAEIAERIEALEAEMRESTETFILRALPQKKSPRDDRPTWRELLDRHPPRREADGEIVDADKGTMLNTETFYEDLIRVSVVSPEMDETDWDDLFGVITNAQFGELSMGAWLLNRGEVDIPFSLAASRMRRATADE